MRTSAKGEGVDQMRTPASRGIEVGKGVFLRTFFMDDSIISSLCGGRSVWVESAVFWRMPAIFVEREARKGDVHKGRPQRDRAYFKRAVQPICAVHRAKCAVQPTKVCSPKITRRGSLDCKSVKY